ncbi:hypothetical protein CMV_022600 [Castanea mollissima]|uniref:Uncharacterized protein n=1 Tax=Castanea mollissima TaxID=60419 RepID=A0A8J4QHP8_9ROSI|nr:hypothetical protein CMV_022600 [Castanea mollissima]
MLTPKPVKELEVELEEEEAAAELAGTDIEGAVEAEDGVKPNEGTENEGCDVVVVVVGVVVEAAGVEAVVVVIVGNNGAAAELGFAADVVENGAAEEGVRNEKGVVDDDDDEVVVAADGDGVGFEKAEAVENESAEEDAVEFGANENEGAVVEAEAEEEEEEPAKRFEEAERNGDEVELVVDSDVANGDRDGVDPNRGEVVVVAAAAAVVEDPKRDEAAEGVVVVVVAAVVENPKRDEAAEGVVVADGVVPKRGEVVVAAVAAVRNGEDEVVDAAGGVEAELKGKEKGGVEDPNAREAGGAEEIGFAAVVVVVEEKGEGEDPNGEVDDPNGEAEDPNEKAEALAVVLGWFEKEKGEGVDCEEVVVVEETVDPNEKPDIVTLSLTLSLLLWVWASDFDFGVLKK